MIQRKKTISLTVFESRAELSSTDYHLLQAAQQAALNAYAPYSDFKVGAALALDNQVVVTGNNQENAAYPSGLCAERVALFYAQAQYPDIAIQTLAVVAFRGNELTKMPVTPCGACRQVLCEVQQRSGRTVRLLMGSESQIYLIDSALDLLPFQFKLFADD